MNCGRTLLVCAAVAAGICLLAAPARAGTIQFTVTLNTASLEGNPAPGYQVNFQLTGNDNGLASGYNTATVSGANFGAAPAGDPAPGAGAVDTADTFGDASGNLASSVALDDAGSVFDSSFTQTFTAGDALSFLVDLTTNVEPGQFSPDEFTVALLDGFGNEVSTTDPNGSFVTVDISSATPAVQTFDSLDGAITVTEGTPVATPEPSALVLLGLGLLVMALVGWRRGWNVYAGAPGR